MEEDSGTEIDGGGRVKAERSALLKKMTEIFRSLAVLYSDASDRLQKHIALMEVGDG